MPKLKTEGKKNDANKPMWQLLPFDALDSVVRVFTSGAEKYGDRNWENGINYSRVIGAVLRHISAWAQGNRVDEETGESHLAHAACGILFLLAYELRGQGAFDDLPKLG